MSNKHNFASGVFVICIILCFTFALVAFAKFQTSDSTYLSSIGTNWKKGPISAIEAASLKCPEGKETIIHDFWEGTESGCSCPEKKLKTGKCSNKDSDSGCKDIKPIDPLPYLMWKGVNFCGKRGPNYLEQKISTSAKNCGENFKSCGVVDSLENYLCYPKNVECPYNFMRNIKKDYPIPKDKKYNAINLGIGGNQGVMIFSNENLNGEVVSEFKIDDNVPCLSPDYKNYLHTPYILEKSYKKQKCDLVAGETINKLYQKIDEISYVNLYNDNQIMGAVDNLPDFTKDYNYLNKSTNLYYRNYIGMKRECIDKLTKEKTKEKIIIDIINKDDDVKVYVKYCLIGLIFSAVGLLIFLVFCVKAIFSGTFGENGNWFNWICLFVVTIPNVVIGFILIIYTNNSNFDVKTMAEPGCTDPFTSSALNKFCSDIDTGRNMIIAYLLFGIIGFISNILNIIFYKVENNNIYNPIR